jgi:acyl dehydratase
MSLDWTTIRVGDPIRPLELEMTATRIVAGAIATRDFMPVHHDRAYANSQGAPDIFMNILSSTAYCSRFLTDWAGSDAKITRLAVRIGVPVFPDSILRFTGQVTDTELRGGDGQVGVEFTAFTSLGEHVAGTATISLPVP